MLPPGGIGRENWIGLHMDNLLIIMETEIRGRKMVERLGNVKGVNTRKRDWWRH